MNVHSQIACNVLCFCFVHIFAKLSELNSFLLCVQISKTDREIEIDGNKKTKSGLVLQCGKNSENKTMQSMK